MEVDFMVNVKRCGLAVLFALALFLPAVALCADQSAPVPLMPDPGKKVPIGGGYYLIYGFDKTPKLGMVIMKVEIFNKDGKKDASFEVKGDTDMPSMRGAHASGDQPFKLSKKGDYLLPVNIVMPGDWEIKITVVKDGKVVARGRYLFNV
jgi:hypothetical protein